MANTCEDDIMSLIDEDEMSGVLDAPCGSGTSRLIPSTETTQSFDMKDAILAMQNQIQVLSNKVLGKDTNSKLLESQNESSSSCRNLDLEAVYDLLPEDSIYEVNNSPLSPEGANPVTADNDALFQNLVAFLELEKKPGKSVDDRVKTLVDNVLKQRLAETKLKGLLVKYDMPANLEMLQTTQINEVIWNGLRNNTRASDVKLQKMQVCNIKAITALTTLMDDILSTREKMGTQATLIKITDALALLGSANMELNHFRRELIRPDLRLEYRNLCNRSNPVTTMLMGDDVSQKLRDIAEANRVSARISTANRGRGRGSRPPYTRGTFRGRGFSRGSGHFLDRGMMGNKRARGQMTHYRPPKQPRH